MVVRHRRPAPGYGPEANGGQAMRAGQAGVGAADQGKQGTKEEARKCGFGGFSGNVTI